MAIRISGATLIDPGNISAKKDIVIDGHFITAVLDPGENKNQTVCKSIDARGMIVVPGLIDIHVHLREPGYEYKETIKTGLSAAVRGGFTAVCSMPNTEPVNDNSQVTQFIINRANQLGLSKVYPVGAITLGLRGETLADFSHMQKAGIVAITDDGRPVEDSNVMRRALESSKALDLPVFVHAEDFSVASGGSMNQGPSAVSCGLKGIPNAVESSMVIRDIALSELMDASVHFCHISTKESVQAIRKAKERGINVTCETAPHYFTLTDEDVKEDANFKMNPPLRSQEDKQAVIQGLVDGTIDLIASDHAPHSITEKNVEFEKAPFGIVGLETSLSLSLKLVHDGFLTLEALIDKMTKQPAQRININNDIKPGNSADLTVIDTDLSYRIDPEQFKSKSKNSPFSGVKVKGKPVLTMVNGKIVYQSN